MHHDLNAPREPKLCLMGRQPTCICDTIAHYNSDLWRVAVVPKIRNGGLVAAPPTRLVKFVKLAHPYQRTKQPTEPFGGDYAQSGR